MVAWDALTVALAGSQANTGAYAKQRQQQSGRNRRRPGRLAFGGGGVRLTLWECRPVQKTGFDLVVGISPRAGLGPRPRPSYRGWVNYPGKSRTRNEMIWRSFDEGMIQI